ncbi:MAG: CooT family nickel-binding protein [Candidatus Bathyarchaeia archaeon]|jgi:predicted RNA-binding protein
MCEFNVILNGKIEFKDVIYAKTEGNMIVVRDIMGASKEFSGYKIIEVDVPNARLVLTQT